MFKHKNIRAPLVTVLMNCYNEEKFIYKAIKSILQQSYKCWELIVWDDASKDKTVEIIKSFKDKRIKLFVNKKHLGLGLSRIKAQKKIKGDYIAISDADDYSSPKRIEKQLKIFQLDKNISLVCSWVKMVDIKDRVIGRIQLSSNDEKIKESLLWENVLPHTSIMYNKKIAKKNGWYSEKLEYAQDYDLSLKLLKNHKCYVIKEFLTYARIRADSMTYSKKLQKRRIQEHLINLKNVKKLYKINGHSFRLNSRSIKLSELKLLLTNINFNNVFLILIKIIEILIQFPEIILIKFKKLFFKKTLRLY